MRSRSALIEEIHRIRVTWYSSSSAMRLNSRAFFGTCIGNAPKRGSLFPLKSNRSRKHGNAFSPSDQRPSVISAQRITVLPLRNAITLGSIAAGRSWPTTAVAAIMSQRSLKTTDIAVLPSGLRALST